MTPDQVEHVSTDAEMNAAVDSLVKNLDRAPEARGFDVSQIEKGYWRSASFIGTYLAIGLTFMASVGGFTLPATLLTVINDDLGPDPNVVWVPLANTLGAAITYQIVGRLSDLFGRRWFFIIGSLFSLIGSILGATAQSISQMIATQVFIGIAIGFGASFYWVIGELVPIKWRFLANSGLFIITTPCNPLAPVVALAFQEQTNVGWRGCFYFLIAANTLATALWYFFYHPPTFEMLHRRQRAKELLRRFDWIGMFLYTLGLLLFLLGLSWGGSLYPWKSAHVLGTLLVGTATLGLFAAWEIFLPIKNAEPFMAIYLFKNIQFQSCAWLAGISGSCWYGFSILWPMAVNTLYTDVQGGTKGWLSSVVLMCYVYGEAISGIPATFIGPRVTTIGAMIISAPILMAAAANPLNMTLTVALVATGTTFLGFIEGVTYAACTIPLRSQEEIGTAGGLCGAIRAFVCAIGTAVYTTVLTNRLAQTVPQYVHPAAVAAGLPSSSLPALITGLQGTTSLNGTAIPGLTPSILTLAQHAFKVANAEAYKTCFYVTFAFSGVGLFLVWFVPGMDARKSQFVAGHIHKVRDEKELEEEEG